MAPIQFGTKMMFISSAKWNELWIIFIENVVMIATTLLFIILSYLYVGFGRFSILKFLSQSLRIFSSFKGFICALISGFSNASANFIIVFAIKMNIGSGGSPGAMNWVLILNTVICLAAGIYLFHEKHRYWKYVGGVIIFLAIILLTLERNFELPGFHTIDENLKYIYSILLAICSWVLWSITAISGKYAIYYYEWDPIEYGNLSMMIWGLFGSLTFIYLSIEITPFGLAEGESFTFTLIRITIKFKQSWSSTSTLICRKSTLLFDLNLIQQ